ISLAGFFILWELVGQRADIFVVAPATTVFRQLWESLASGELWPPTMGTLKVAFVGFGISIVLGVSIGMLVGRSRLAAEVLDPAINGAFATPMHMLIPVLGIYFGLGFSGKVFLVVVMAIFVIIIN